MSNVQWRSANNHGGPIYLSPTARYLGFGNGQVYVHDFHTNTTTHVGDGWPAGWKDTTTLAMSVQGDGNTRLGFVVDLLTGTKVAQDIPPWQCPGYGGQTANGHTVSSIPTGWHGSAKPGYSIFCDGVDVTPPEQVMGGCPFDGHHYCYRLPDQQWATAIRNINHELVRIIPGGVDRWAPDIFTDPSEGCWHFSVVGGVPVINTPDGVDITLWAGESRGVLTWHNGEMLVWTTTFDQGEQVLLGRPMDRLYQDTPAVTVRGVWQVELQIIPGSSGWVAVGHHIARGEVTMGVAAFDQPRRVYAPITSTGLPTMTFPEKLRAVWCVAVGDGKIQGPGHLDWSYTGTSRPHVEGGSWAVKDAEDGHPAAVIFHDMRELPDRMVELARQTGAALVLYHDKNEVNPHLALIADLRSQGVAAIIGHQCYPVQDDVDKTLWAVTSALEAYQATGMPVMLVRPVYLGNGVGNQPVWRQHVVCSINLKLTDLIQSFSCVLLDAAFAWMRSNGPQDYPWLKTYWTQRVLRTDRPMVALPRTVLARPVPPVWIPPVVEPPEDTGYRKPSVWSKLLRWLKRRF
jgi:hypothetical protein